MHRIPNVISILRGVACVPVVLLLTPATAVLALTVFSIAALSDAVDGPLARRLRATSALGAFLDPLADKVLVLGTLGGLLARGDVDPLPVGLILAREVAVTGVRAIAAGRDITIASNVYGKAKAVLQGAAVVGQLAVLAWPPLGPAAIADALLWVAAAITLLTGADVLRRASGGLAQASTAAQAHAP